MTNRLKEMGEAASWRLMVDAAVKGAEADGYRLERKPGRGLSNTWTIAKDGTSQVAALRTSRDRWLAFPPLDKGKRWKTLDDVDLVLAAVADDYQNPQMVEVYLFPADEVRKRFDAAYAARIAAGNVVRDDFGMWVNVDPDDRRVPVAVGAGLAKPYPPIARFSIDELVEAPAAADEARTKDVGAQSVDDHDVGVAKSASATVADVLRQTREQIARITGVATGAIKLDLKIEY